MGGRSSRPQESFDEKVVKAIPAHVQVITITPDRQLPNPAVGQHNNNDDNDGDDVTNLPSSHGKAGGIASRSLLQALDRNDINNNNTKHLLRDMKQQLELHENSIQSPMLLSSRKSSIQAPLLLVPPQCTGKKYALLIALEYKGKLRGSHATAMAWKKYLQERHNFAPKHITILSDHEERHDYNYNVTKVNKTEQANDEIQEFLPPTHGNILNAFRYIAQTAQNGDAVVVQFIGHASLTPPLITQKQFEEKQQQQQQKRRPMASSSVLFPSDYSVHPSRRISQDDLLRTLIVPLKSGVHMTMVLDTCHGAGSTVLALPYKYKVPSATDTLERDEMVREGTFEILGAIGVGIALGGAIVAAEACNSGDCCDAAACDAVDCCC